MMRWLHKLLIRVWYWRHRHVTLEVRRYLDGARGTFWCTHCGGTITAEQSAGREACVLSSSCPEGRDYMRLGPPP